MSHLIWSTTSKNMPNQIALIDPRILRPHEKVNYFRLFWLLIKISSDGAFTRPLLVDSESKTILDGHHRCLVAKILGLKRVPCWCIQYLQTNAISVEPRRADISVSKKEIVERARLGNLYPHKTTRHIYTAPNFASFPLHQLKTSYE
ncbi:MAG: hypothetical protein DDT19_02000 [Syntrophomonadaceae bacterium]|nr:hypothetical protein [Bacillota bacterium]